MTGTHVDSATNVLLCTSTISQQTTVFAVQPPSISQINNGSGSFSFTANNTLGGMTCLWNFNDGSPTVTGTSVTHVFANPGMYWVTLNATNSTCQYSAYATVIYYNGSLNCSLDTPDIYKYGSGFTSHFMNNSYYPNLPIGVKKVSHWDFGDGNTLTDTTCCVMHTYVAGGSYTVTLVSDLIDSATNTLLCSSTISKNYTISPPPIEGNIYYDSLSVNLAQTTFKVWLITHDATANTLTAVDSTIVSSLWHIVTYSFNGHPSGSYLVKAAPMPGTPGATSIMPTYHDSSLYWNAATMINHTGTNTTAHIWAKNGMPGTGQGFISGNISQGANKGTGAGVPDLMVALLNSANQVVGFTYTNTNGDYAFNNLDLGTYIVFPESMNYLTTPSSSLNITSGQTHVTGIHFKHTSTEIKPYPTEIENMAKTSMFSISPNPTKGSLKINWQAGMKSSADITIMDITGRTAMTMETTTGQSTTVNIGSLQSGIYFIKVVSDNSQHTEKLILRH
jgi:hypothetical protein